MREAEEDGGGDPTGGIAVGGAGEKILQEAAEEEFFGEGGEEKNCDGEWEEGFPLREVRGVDEEMEFQAYLVRRRRKNPAMAMLTASITVRT